MGSSFILAISYIIPPYLNEKSVMKLRLKIRGLLKWYKVMDGHLSLLVNARLLLLIVHFQYGVDTKFVALFGIESKAFIR
jgi:hypothetical protein